MVSARHEYSTLSATSPAFTNGFHLRGILLVVRETCLVLKMSVTLGAGNSNFGEGGLRACNKIATRLVTRA